MSAVASHQISKNNDLAFGLSGLLTAPIGYLVLLFLPVYLEVVAKTMALTDQQIGHLASTDSVGIVIATLLFSFFIQKLQFRQVTLVGVAITVLANLASALTDSFTLLCFIRIIAGFGEGLLVAVGITAIGMTSNPNRWFGFYTAVVVGVQALGLVTVAPIYQAGGLIAVFVAMAALYLLPLLVVKQLPQNTTSYLTSEEANPCNHYIAPKYFLIALAGLLCFYIGIGSTWTYISFAGTDAGLSLDYVSQALALAMIAGLLGALFFAWLNDKGKNAWLLSLSVVIMGVSLIAVLFDVSEFKYLMLLSVFSFFWSIVGARTFAIISDADHSGKYISAAQTLVGVGYIIGPMMAAQIIVGYSYLGVNTMGAIAFMLCFALMMPLARKSR
ncbi:MFS transporter [Pseudoalteromonas sp. GCY]|uniref:MFS transporter n=1 Tax=Pseudoalteromonas sp. GCY TaxID=2003316 RepID=UPI000BFED42E|nr:MFS transporter [Pseudoalteromonas sp. GCY]PHI35709.1 MFS transporter [Pseudoalteromonas sp. GCY]QQQ67992.1 MFS transporter [Pseudoalteromonas sp. GCY]